MASNAKILRPPNPSMALKMLKEHVSLQSKAMRSNVNYLNRPPGDETLSRKVNAIDPKLMHFCKKARTLMAMNFRSFYL